ALLKMKACTRKLGQIARVVVVQVRDDDVLDVRTIDAQQSQSFARLTQQLPPATLRSQCIKAGIDDHGARVIAGYPDKIVDGYGALVRIATDENLCVAAQSRGVADGIELIGPRLTHRRSLPATAPGISRSRCCQR